MRVSKNLAIVCCYLLLTVLASGIGQHAVAASARQRLEQNNIQKREIANKVAQLKREKVELNSIIHTYDQRINEKESEVRQVEKQLKLANDSLAQMEVERKQIEDNLAGYRDALAGRLRSMYMQGDMSYLDLLFNASNFGDLVDRIFFVQSICSRDETLISRTQEDQAALASKIEQINFKIAEIDNFREALRKQHAELTAVKRSKKDDLNAINSNIDLYNRQTAELEASNKRIEAEIRSMGRSASSYKGAPWKASFKRPCSGPITSGYGRRRHPIFGGNRMHTGIDIAAPRGTPIVAAGDGKVVTMKWYGGYGNCVIVDHGNGRSTLYGHCSAFVANVGDVVKAGQTIAKVGSTGNSTGNHLHFEVRINGSPVDPFSQSSL